MVEASLAVFYTDKFEILLHDRRGRSKYGEDWSFFGGKLEEGESPEMALEREVKEELGFDIKDYSPLVDYNTKIDDGRILRRYVFISPVTTDLRKLLDHPLPEGNKAQLHPFHTLRSLNLVRGSDKIISELEFILV